MRIRRIRRRWPETHVTFRGDGHYARPEAMTWCEQNGIDYIFGLSSTKPLAKKVDRSTRSPMRFEPTAPWTTRR
jgi:hypothetical protein